MGEGFTSPWLAFFLLLSLYLAIIIYKYIFFVNNEFSKFCLFFLFCNLSWIWFFLWKENYYNLVFCFFCNLFLKKFTNIMNRENYQSFGFLSLIFCYLSWTSYILHESFIKWANTQVCWQKLLNFFMSSNELKKKVPLILYIPWWYFNQRWFKINIRLKSTFQSVIDIQN